MIDAGRDFLTNMREEVHRRFKKEQEMEVSLDSLTVLLEKGFPSKR